MASDTNRSLTTQGATSQLAVVSQQLPPITLVRNAFPVPATHPAGAVRCSGLPLTSSEWKMISLHLSLSVRESQITRLLLDDRSESDIAAQLGIAARTVHAHLERVYRKLHIHTRCQLLLRLFDTYISLHSGHRSELA